MTKKLNSYINLILTLASSNGVYDMNDKIFCTDILRELFENNDNSHDEIKMFINEWRDNIQNEINKLIDAYEDNKISI